MGLVNQSVKIRYEVILMFMRENRRKNGAPQPESTMANDEAGQRAAHKLSENDYSGLEGADWRFTPQMSTCAAINEEHYMAGLQDSGPYRDLGESKIPFVGIKEPGSDKLKIR